MAKCTECGKKGLFLKVNARGFCEKCQPIVAQRTALKDLEDRTAEVERRARNADALLEAAKNEARTEAQKQLDAREKQVQAELAALMPLLN